MTLKKAVSMEYDLAVFAFLRAKINNFDIGVDHLLNKKLKTRPPWRPSSIYEISDDEVQSAFENNTGIVMTFDE